MRYKLDLEFDVPDVLCTTYLREALREVLAEYCGSFSISKLIEIVEDQVINKETVVDNTKNVEEYPEARTPLATTEERSESLEQWEHAGKPHRWVRIISKEDLNATGCNSIPKVHLDSDYAYGHLRLSIEVDGEIDYLHNVVVGKDFVHCKEYVGLSEYYGFKKAILLKIM